MEVKKLQNFKMAQFAHLGYFPRFLSYIDPETEELVVSRPTAIDGAVVNCSEVEIYDESDKDIPNIWLPPYYAASMYWKVKKWKFSYRGEWEEDGSGASKFEADYNTEINIGQERLLELDRTPEPSYELVTVYDETSGTIPPNEKELICELSLPDFLGANIFGIDIFDQSVTTSPPSSSGSRINIGLSWESDRSHNETYYNLFFHKKEGNSLEFQPILAFTASTQRWTMRANNWDLATGTHGTFNLIIEGQTFSCPIYAFNSRDGTELDVNFTLEAIEYWPYDP
jgi:hypothetical protein